MGSCLDKGSLHVLARVNSNCCNKNLSFSCSHCQTSFCIVQETFSDNEHRFHSITN